MAHPFQRIAGILKQLAPTVLTAVGGPAGAVAGAIIKSSMGVPADQDVAAAVQDALTTPEGMEKIRLAEVELKKFEQQNGIRFAELDVQDRSSARDLARATGIWPQVALSVLFVGGYFTILGLFFAQELRVPMNEAFMVMLGVLTAGVPQILNFWLGSSHGSQNKDATIAALGSQ